MTDDLKRLLEELKTKANAPDKSQKALFIFDIDSTLLHVHKRNHAILKSFLALTENQRKFEREIKSCLNLEFSTQDWGISEVLKRHGLVNLGAEFIEQLDIHWHKTFFGPNFLPFDELTAGALDFLKTIESLGYEMVYLTARDEPRMGSGTRDYLEKHRLPLHERARLFMKPHKDIQDAQFKSDAVKELAANFEAIYFFDNEPVILQKIAQDHPEVRLFFMETTHSRRAEAPVKATRLKNFLLD